ncbi:MAG: PilZ domain-containing protein [Chromatiales bacterium]|jgi:hypothetical protein
MSLETESNSRDERREFFRIDDSILVNWRLIGAPELSDGNTGLENMPEQSFTIITRLQAVSRHLAGSLHRIEQRDPDVADYLKALDEKITLLAQNFMEEEVGITAQVARSVNLSAGGLALDSSQRLQVGDQVEIKLLLLPSYTGVVALGEVIRITEGTETSDHPYRLHINFTHIQESDRDALIGHILRRQGEMLRRERALRERAQE